MAEGGGRRAVAGRVTPAGRQHPQVERVPAAPRVGAVDRGRSCGRDRGQVPADVVRRERRELDQVGAGPAEQVGQRLEQGGPVRAGRIAGGADDEEAGPVRLIRAPRPMIGRVVRIEIDAWPVPPPA